MYHVRWQGGLAVLALEGRDVARERLQHFYSRYLARCGPLSWVEHCTVLQPATGVGRAAGDVGRPAVPPAPGRALPQGADPRHQAAARLPPGQYPAQPAALTVWRQVWSTVVLQQGQLVWSELEPDMTRLLVHYLTTTLLPSIPSLPAPPPTAHHQGRSDRINFWNSQPYKPTLCPLQVPGGRARGKPTCGAPARWTTPPGGLSRHQLHGVPAAVQPARAAVLHRVRRPGRARPVRPLR